MGMDISSNIDHIVLQNSLGSTLWYEYQVLCLLLYVVCMKKNVNAKRADRTPDLQNARNPRLRNGFSLLLSQLSYLGIWILVNAVSVVVPLVG